MFLGKLSKHLESTDHVKSPDLIGVTDIEDQMLIVNLLELAVSQAIAAVVWTIMVRHHQGVRVLLNVPI